MQDCCIGTYGNVVCCFHPPITYLWHFSPCYHSPTSLPPAVLPLLPPNRPQCVMLPSLCPCVLIVQHAPMSENMRWLIFCSCQFAENGGFQVHPCPCKGHKLIIFEGCIIFHGVYVPHFPSPVYHRWAFGFPGLCYCKQCCNEHLCACVLIVEWCIIL